MGSRGGDEQPVRRHEHGSGGSEDEGAEEPRRRGSELGVGPFIVLCARASAKPKLVVISI